MAGALMLLLVLDVNSRPIHLYADTPRLGVLFLFVPLLGIMTGGPMTIRLAPRLGVSSIIKLIGPRLGHISEHTPRLGASIVSTMAPRLESLIDV